MPKIARFRCLGGLYEPNNVGEVIRFDLDDYEIQLTSYL